MRKFLILAFLALVLTTYSFAAQPTFKKVIWVVLENTNYSEAIAQPGLLGLTKKGALFTNFLAEAHPSQPNYIAMISGSTQGVTGDRNIDLKATHLGDLIEAKKLTWKNYAEDYPGGCFTGATTALYARKHVPFMSFTNVNTRTDRCARIVNADQFAQDLSKGTLPDFSFYSPNLNNDGHNSSATVADQWLTSKFGSMLADPKVMDELLFIVTFDESETYVGANKVFTVMVGANVNPGAVVSAQMNHYSLLKMIEDTLDLGTLGRGDATAAVPSGIWR